LGEFVGQHGDIEKEKACADDRLDDAQIPTIAFKINLLERQSAVAHIVRRDFEPHGIPLAAVIRIARENRIDWKGDAFQAGWTFAVLLADAFLERSIRLHGLREYFESGRF